VKQYKLKLSIQKVIQVLGAPVMDYSPTHANLEREIIIDKGVSLLFKLLRDLETTDE
jgi:hypothetical protein